MEDIKVISRRSDLEAIAEAVRIKTESTDKMTLQEIALNISNFAGADLPDLSKPASAAEVLQGKEIINQNGNKITGTMPNNGYITKTMDGLETTIIAIPPGYTSGGQVSLDNTIENEADEQADLIDLIIDTANTLPNSGGGTIEPVLQEKIITPTIALQTVIADSGYDGLAKVTVNAIPASFVQPMATKGATTYTPSTSDQTIAGGTYLAGDQTIKGDANLIAGNIKSGVSIFGVNGTLAEGGGTAENQENALLEGTIANYTNDSITKLRVNAFEGYTTLKTVNLPQCSHINNEAFYQCTALTTASFATCLSIGSSAFQGCTKLQTLSLPMCKSIYWAGFSTCTSLTTINLPACTYLGGRVFQGCTKLTTTSLPLVRYIYSSTFQSCKSLATISLPNISVIGSTAFGSCTKLASIYLAGSSLCTLSGSNAFTGTGITSTAGAIYVPASLVDAYKAATNWTYFANRIYAIEG